MRQFSYSLMLIFVLQSCSLVPSYDVRIVNSTGETLIVDYASQYAKNGGGQVEVKDGDSAVIIKTPDIDLDKELVCNQVATTISATRPSDRQLSSLEWCSDAIKLELVDIGEYQFVVHYTRADFD